MHSSPLQVVLISTYELGHQPFGLASPAAWLRAEGAEVTCFDLAVQDLDETRVREADLVACYVPMHTATRLAAQVIPSVRRLNPGARVCAYGLYAPVNADYLASLGVHDVIGGEFEAPLAELLRRMRAGGAADEPASPRTSLPIISLGRQDFAVPERSQLPPLSAYASLAMPDGSNRTAGYTEATRGCKHLCRHCPIVPVYGGRFRVVQREVVLRDIEQQVEAGAQHITFGDPDFFNAPAHALAVVQELNDRFPDLSYDVTIKVEHLVKQARRIPVLAETGCLLVTTAVEAFDELLLEIFDKRHTRQDFVEAVRILRHADIAMNPTFVAFTPWTTLEMYIGFLVTLYELELVGNVAPVQYAIRLLIPEGSRLLELDETHTFLRGFDSDALCHRWKHPEPQMDELQRRLFQLTAETLRESRPRHEVFRQVCEATADYATAGQRRRLAGLRHFSAQQQAVPSLTEPWYCCAEPVDQQMASPPV